MFILAQAGEITGWGQIVAQVASTGFAGMMAWYLIAKVIPAMQQKFSEDLTLQRNEFLAAQVRSREDEKAELQMIQDHATQLMTMAIDAKMEPVRRMTDQLERLTNQEEVSRRLAEENAVLGKRILDEVMMLSRRTVSASRTGE